MKILQTGFEWATLPFEPNAANHYRPDFDYSFVVVILRYHFIFISLTGRNLLDDNGMNITGGLINGGKFDSETRSRPSNNSDNCCDPRAAANVPSGVKPAKGILDEVLNAP